MGIGLTLAHNGGTIWRRATSWIGGATMAVGLALFLGDNAGDSVTTAGMLYIAGGIGMVFIGFLIASGSNEPDELTVTASATVAEAPRRVLVAEPAAPGPSTDPAEDEDPTPSGSPPCRHPQGHHRLRHAAAWGRRRAPREGVPTSDPSSVPTGRGAPQATTSSRGGSSQPSRPPPGPAGWVRGYGVTKPLPGSSVVAKRTMASVSAVASTRWKAGSARRDSSAGLEMNAASDSTAGTPAERRRMP